MLEMHVMVRSPLLSRVGGGAGTQGAKWCPNPGDGTGVAPGGGWLWASLLSAAFLGSACWRCWGWILPHSCSTGEPWPWLSHIAEKCGY